MVDAVERLLGAPCGHYHSKVMQKAPRTGGAWEWHQDYAYWYRNGFLFPDMLSVMVPSRRRFAPTASRGDSRLAPDGPREPRQHRRAGGRRSRARLGRDAPAPKVYAELAPGDALFFHCNLLHASGQNTSEHPRWSIISAYNVLTNTPLRSEEPRSCVTPIARVPDAAPRPRCRRRVGRRRFLDKSNRAYQERRD